MLFIAIVSALYNVPKVILVTIEYYFVMYIGLAECLRHVYSLLELHIPFLITAKFHRNAYFFHATTDDYYLHTLNPSSEKSIPDDMDVHGAPNLYALYYTGVYTTYFLLHMQVDAKKFVIQLQ